MEPIRVTFDRNVFEKVLFPRRYASDFDHQSLMAINHELELGRLKGYVCETFGTIETIERSRRREYFGSAEATGSATSEANPVITIALRHDPHPGLHPKLGENFRKARALGMRLLSAPRLNLPLPAEFDLAFYDSKVFSSGYAERFGDALAQIEAHGDGGAGIATILKSGSNKRITEAVAEWADIDAVAAHIASENDLLCTDDRAKGRQSIFDATNRAWLARSFKVKVVEIRELTNRLSRTT